MNAHGKNLERLIRTKSACVGVVGLGYVGFPLAVALAKGGFHVLGYDVDPVKRRTLSRGLSYISDVPSRDVGKLVRGGVLSSISNPSDLGKADIVIVCVPTPLGKSKEPDISFVVAATDAVAAALRRGQLIVLESTTYPGTTREVVLQRLESGGLRAGRDFFLSFSPERIDPGNAEFGLKNTPKIVSGLTSSCLRLAKELYSAISDRVHSVSSLEAAEMSKLLENTFRAVNIALVNEVALMCNRLQLNVWEVIEAAGTKPFGFMKFFPGPGIGGHCIPLDPHYLSWKLKTLDFRSRFIDLATDINSFMPRYVVDRAIEALNRKGKALRGSKVLVLGVSYKKNISDVRESPALRIMSDLVRLGARTVFSDPLVKTVRVNGSLFHSRSLTLNLLADQDLAIVVSDHDGFDLQWVARNVSLLLDTRNAARDVRSRGNIVTL